METFRQHHLTFGISLVVFLLLLVQTFQIISVSKRITGDFGSSTGGSTGGIDMGGWTEDEKMQYEHHGVLPARLKGSQQGNSPQSAMVGGC